ncbi:putative virus X resistance protein-like, coiled-coil [Helianthus annuus]|nr:putative virus X resistance protein-like, coiled-coil [Helianthus annuus]
MAEIVLSSFLSVIFEKLASAALETLAPYFETGYDIEKLKRSSLQIQSLLVDASQKETTNQFVKRWLNDLRHLAYDVEDVLDELATDAIHSEWTDQSETHTSKVRKLFPNPFSKYSSYSRTMKDKIDVITTKLQQLLEEKDALGLVVIEESRSTNVNRRLQTSMVHESSIFGRRVEKEALVHKLLRDEPCGQNFSVVPIVGMGGVGKTTLARLVYDEPEVTEHFELKAWVCVSDEFDSFGISKVIFQSVTGETTEFKDLNLLQEALRDHLREKRLLLVLDDVWSESCQDWDTLVGPFYACAPGSKIIMTIRKDQLLKKLGYGNLGRLRTLSHDDALSLLALHALGVSNFDSHLSLKPHGVGIVKKCDGLPLALKAVGRLLSTRIDEEGYWKKVLDSEIWRLSVEGEIVPALILSYHDLSAHLKQLFAYCSLFPKDCLFDKEDVVRLWMAEGFLQQSTPSDSNKECLGHEYFDELLSRSFFQHAPNNESLFVMHDLMNDLAKSVAGEFFLRLENINMEEALEKYRHMSFVCEECIAYKKFEAFKRAKSLRTFMAVSVGVVGQRDFYLSNKILVDLLPELPLLRVLCLSGSQISEVPESVGNLRHLRYLNLSRTRITQLPENVSNLYNLEMLILFGCRSLAKLTNNFLKLKNLGHLDIRDTPNLHQLPLGIGELKCLQTLSKFIIRGESGFKITKLKDLKNLCGEFSIEGVDKVHNAMEARDANFSQKRLNEFTVVWSEPSANEMRAKEVLNELRPSNDYLKQLNILSYDGLEFPKWVGDPSFQQLKHVSINGGKKCTFLPPLGQLQSLKELFIGGLDGVKVVGLELLGTSSAFLSLETLHITNTGGLEKWSTNSGVVFPLLQKLVIANCRNLVEVTLKVLPSLNVLRLYDCPNLVEVSVEALSLLNVLQIHGCDSGVVRRLVEITSVVTEFQIKDISGLDDVVWRGVIKYLGTIEKLSVENCNELRYLWESEATASKVLVNLNQLTVQSCGNLVSLGEKEERDNCRSNFLTSLKTLLILSCENIKRCSCPYSIEVLWVSFCNSITDISLPTGSEKLKSLKIDGCKKLLEREWGRQKMLENVEISGWPNQKSIIELKYLVHLTRLYIEDCENLESFPDNELPNLTSLKNLHIVNCQSMDASFPRGIWPPNLCFLTIGELKKPILEWGPQNFPTSLVKLRLYGGEDGVSSCSQLSHLLPSSLTSLTIYGFEKLESVSMGLQHLTSLQRLEFCGCPNLKKVSDLQHLTSLQHLYFIICPNMMDLPEMILPSLLSLQICLCPKLKERWSKSGSHWPLVSHIPCIYI